MRQRTLGLRAPQLVGRYFDGAHRVFFDTNACHHDLLSIIPKIVGLGRRATPVGMHSQYSDIITIRIKRVISQHVSSLLPINDAVIFRRLTRGEINGRE